jgi:ABC-2 type transport system ATP-binding protein
MEYPVFNQERNTMSGTATTGTATTVTAAAVEVEDLRKTYPSGVEAVRGIDFTVAPGEVFGLLGPNGAGKSTTIGMLTTTVTPTAGRARLAGFDVSRQPLLARGVSSVVFQDTVVDGSLSGRENLELHGRLWGVPAAQATRRIGELVDAIGLSELIDRPVSSFSGGQRRRLEIARALVSTPRVLFLDEPTVGLDPRIRHELLDVIAGLRAREEMTIVMTTHYLEEAERLCDRVAIVHLGEIEALDSPRALLAGLGDEILEFRVSGDAQAALATLRGADIAGEDAFAVGARVTVPLHGRAASEALAAMDSEPMRFSEIATRVPTLDDVYLNRTGAQLAGVN